jgi:spore maturation protein CgeB
LKIVVAGDWHSQLHEEAMSRALIRLGHTVEPFAWHRYFLPCAGTLGHVNSLFKRAQNKYLVGPALIRANRDLVELANREHPAAIIVYRGTHVFPETLRRMRHSVPGVILIGYNNDDPFAPGQFALLFRHFLAGIAEYDLILAYRRHNLDDYRRAGARKVELLYSWYVPECNRPVALDPGERDKYDCDVVFVGHYEDDGRVAFFEEIVRRGWRFRLFGPDWEGVTDRSPELAALGRISPVWGEEYNKALCGAKIALCFFSKLNRDTYTRRCFEIPATRTMMLSEFSADVAAFYREGVEAEFFRDSDDMVRKLERYLVDDSLRRAVADAGWRRVRLDGHDVVTRMRTLVEQIESVGRARK